MDEDTEQNLIQEEEILQRNILFYLSLMLNFFYCRVIIFLIKAIHPPKRRRITMPSDDDSTHSLNHHGQTDLSLNLPGPSNSLILPPPIQLPPLQPEMVRTDTSVPLVPPIRINLSKNRITTPDPSFLNISHLQQPSIVEPPTLPVEPETSLPNNFMVS